MMGSDRVLLCCVICSCCDGFSVCGRICSSPDEGMSTLVYLWCSNGDMAEWCKRHACSRFGGSDCLTLHTVISILKMPPLRDINLA